MVQPFITPTIFLSTPSARRATSGSQGQRRGGNDFYPRPPRGGRLTIRAAQQAVDKFLSTPSARRATACGADLRPKGDVFLSTPSARRATLIYMQSVIRIGISIHALREEGDRTRDKKSAFRS